uniref:Uncharacterized protein n=1 Tax=Rhizophora mucronata TaxID=61149 RepID=A0A2P2IL31_RHIMU
MLGSRTSISIETPTLWLLCNSFKYVCRSGQMG